ncbi:hypothetical protein GIW70_13690, partial [Pseudomonas syringae]|nr:hypothetical protein [Pseudomonas syringae]MCF5069237.1 hypothetical protein [Pseudomonas syringae]
MNSNLQVSQAVVWQETCYVIKAIKPTLGDIVLEAKGGVERAVDIRAFYNLIASGEIELSQRQIEATQRSWTVSEQREADFRQQLLEFQRSLEKQGLDPSTCDAQIDRYCQRHGHKRPSNKTIQRYHKDLKRLGNSEKDFLIWQNTATPPTEFPDEADDLRRRRVRWQAQANPQG